LLVVIRATEKELDLSGSPAELREVASRIVAIAPGQRIRFAADQTAVAEPYDRLLIALEVVASEGALKISVTDETLIAAGNPESIRSFASFLEFEDATPRGFHHHYEWYPGNELIAPDSKPLVVCVGEYPVVSKFLVVLSAGCHGRGFAWPCCLPHAHPKRWARHPRETRNGSFLR
jgi:hypothetical protein